MIKVMQRTISLQVINEGLYSNTVNVLKFQTLVVSQKWPRHTGQTLIRLLLKKQSDQGLPCFYSDKQFVNSSPENQLFI